MKENEMEMLNVNSPEALTKDFMHIMKLLVRFAWPLRLKKAGELATSQSSVLRELRDEGPMTMGDLAERISVAKQTMTNIADKLYSLGYVERCYSPENRRQIILKLTDEGREFINSIDAELAEYYENEVFSSLNTEQIAEFRDSIARIEHLANETVIGRQYREKYSADN